MVTWTIEHRHIQSSERVALTSVQGTGQISKVPLTLNTCFIKVRISFRLEMKPLFEANVHLTTQAKGRVERSIRYIRDNFFAARQWKNLDDLNSQAERWYNEQASNRLCPEGKERIVRPVVTVHVPKKKW